MNPTQSSEQGRWSRVISTPQTLEHDAEVAQ
jgi:hypothetical protein